MLRVIGRHQADGHFLLRFIQDAGRLVDFNFLDEDIMSLRQQMSWPRATSPDGIFTASGSRQSKPKSGRYSLTLFF